MRARDLCRQSEALESPAAPSVCGVCVVYARARVRAILDIHRLSNSLVSHGSSCCSGLWGALHIHTQWTQSTAVSWLLLVQTLVPAASAGNQSPTPALTTPPLLTSQVASLTCLPPDPHHLPCFGSPHRCSAPDTEPARNPVGGWWTLVDGISSYASCLSNYSNGEWDRNSLGQGSRSTSRDLTLLLVQVSLQGDTLV